MLTVHEDAHFTSMDAAQAAADEGCEVCQIEVDQYWEHEAATAGLASYD